MVFTICEYRTDHHGCTKPCPSLHARHESQGCRHSHRAGLHQFGPRPLAEPLAIEIVDGAPGRAGGMVEAGARRLDGERGEGGQRGRATGRYRRAFARRRRRGPGHATVPASGRRSLLRGAARRRQPQYKTQAPDDLRPLSARAAGISLGGDRQPQRPVLHVRGRRGHCRRLGLAVHRRWRGRPSQRGCRLRPMARRIDDFCEVPDGPQNLRTTTPPRDRILHALQQGLCAQTRSARARSPSPAADSPSTPRGRRWPAR